MHVLDTDRLTLRRLGEDDAPFVLELLTDPAFLRFVGDRGVRTLDDARAYVRDGPMASYERFGFGLYLAARREDATPVGICGLLKRDALDDVDLGFAVLPPFRGRGYAAEAAAGVIAHARSALGLGRLVAIVKPENDGSLRVLERLGFAAERAVRLAADGPELRLLALDADGAAHDRPPSPAGRPAPPTGDPRMSDHVYKTIELVGSSPASAEDAVRTAIAKAAETVRNLRWFEVTETRGQIVGGEVAYWQVTIKIGFTLDEG